MFDQIINAPNQRIIDLEYLKGAKIPLILFGSATCAQLSYSLLKTNNISVDYVALDEEFYHTDLFLKDFPIRLIDEILQKETLVNIVFAFEKSRLKMKNYSSYNNVAKCIFFDNLAFPFEDDYIEKTISEFESLYYSLADNLSKKILLAYLKTKKTGCADELFVLNVENEDQYFPSFLHLSYDEVFVDCGAYIGDTVMIFNQYVSGKYNKIYAFECDNASVVKLKENTVNYRKMEIIPKGCYSENAVFSFSDEGTISSKITTDIGEIRIETVKIDDVIKNERVSFIKMDVEGSELEALKGARNTIIKNKPKLAIAVYHKQEDLVTIPSYILSLNENYKIYLRHYGERATETILYAI